MPIWLVKPMRAIAVTWWVRLVLRGLDAIGSSLLIQVDCFLHDPECRIPFHSSLAESCIMKIKMGDKSALVVSGFVLVPLTYAITQVFNYLRPEEAVILAVWFIGLYWANRIVCRGVD